MALAHRLLEGPRLRLRAPELSDIGPMTILENESEWWEAGSPIVPLSEAAVGEFVAHYTGDLLTTRQLRLIAEYMGQLVGMVDLFDYDPIQRRAQVGIIISNAHRRSGFGREALQVLARYASRHLSLEMLWAIVASDNLPSLQLFRSAGYEATTRLKGWLRRPQGRCDAIMAQLYPLSDC